jgi:hypothetical protein
MTETIITVIDENGGFVRVKTDVGEIIELPRRLLPENLIANQEYCLLIETAESVKPKLAKAMLNELLSIEEQP